MRPRASTKSHVAVPCFFLQSFTFLSPDSWCGSTISSREKIERGNATQIGVRCDLSRWSGEKSRHFGEIQGVRSAGSVTSHPLFFLLESPAVHRTVVYQFEIAERRSGLGGIDAERSWEEAQRWTVCAAGAAQGRFSGTAAVRIAK